MKLLFLGLVLVAACTTSSGTGSELAWSLVYKIRGGFAGFNEDLSLNSSGEWTYHSRTGSTPLFSRGVLTNDDIVRLEESIKKIETEQLESEFAPDRTIMDSMEKRVEYVENGLKWSFSVKTAGSPPDQIVRLVRILDTIAGGARENARPSRDGIK